MFSEAQEHEHERDLKCSVLKVSVILTRA